MNLFVFKLKHNLLAEYICDRLKFGKDIHKYITRKSYSSSTSWRSVDLLILKLPLQLFLRGRLPTISPSFGWSPGGLDTGGLFCRAISVLVHPSYMVVPLSRCLPHLTISCSHCSLISVFLALSLLIFFTIVLSVFISATLSTCFVLLMSSRTSVPYVMIGLIHLIELSLLEIALILYLCRNVCI